MNRAHNNIQAGQQSWWKIHRTVSQNIGFDTMENFDARANQGKRNRLTNPGNRSDPSLQFTRPAVVGNGQIFQTDFFGGLGHGLKRGRAVRPIGMGVQVSM